MVSYLNSIGSCFVAVLSDGIFIQNLSFSLVLEDLVSVFLCCNRTTQREPLAENRCKFPQIFTKFSVMQSADCHEFFSDTYFTSFSSLIFERVSYGKTLIGSLLFVGCNIFFIEVDHVAKSHQLLRKYVINN